MLQFEYNELFNSFFKNAKQVLKENAFSVDTYGSSEGDAGRMAKIILETASSKLHPLH